MSSGSSSPQVLIVGAGPAGLIAALALLQNGVPVRIIEKNTEPRIGQRGSGIMPRSLELFSTLGIVDNVLKHAVPVPPVRAYEMPAGTSPIHEFEMAPRAGPTPSCPYLNIVMLGQDRLEPVLHEALAQHSCRVEAGTELISFEQSAAGVEVRLERRRPRPDGGENEKIAETASYQWLIGADGARGIVRKMSRFSFFGETRNVENLVVGDVVVEGLSPEYWHMWGDANSVLISLRPTENAKLFSFILAGKDVNHAELSMNPDAVRKCLIEHSGSRTDIKFTEIQWLSHYTPNIRMVDRLNKGRVFLVGDSAHVHSPTGGQGMNAGIQDSFNLAWKLALVQRNLAPQSLLQTYNEERLPVIKEMLDRTTKILESTFKCKSHNLPWHKGGELLQLGVNCRWSSITVDERKAAQDAEDAEFADYEFGDEQDRDSYGSALGDTLRAGDRAPDAPGLVSLRKGGAHAIWETTTRLFQVFGSSYHTVLVFTPAVRLCPLVLETLRSYPQGTILSALIVQWGMSLRLASFGMDCVFEDKEGHAHEGYAVQDKWGIVVVRPDGVVGAILESVEGLRGYFDRIFGLGKRRQCR